MARKLYEKGLFEAGAPGGGGAGRPTGSLPKSGLSNWEKRENYLKGQIEQSVKERGGFPTSKGVPMQSKMQLRAAQRAAQQPEIDRAKEAAREERKAKFGIRYNKGGMVKGGQNRDYCK